MTALLLKEAVSLTCAPMATSPIVYSDVSILFSNKRAVEFLPSKQAVANVKTASSSSKEFATGYYGIDLLVRPSAKFLFISAMLYRKCAAYSALAVHIDGFEHHKEGL